jgi:hypothetical protein
MAEPVVAGFIPAKAFFNPKSLTQTFFRKIVSKGYESSGVPD